MSNTLIDYSGPSEVRLSVNDTECLKLLPGSIQLATGPSVNEITTDVNAATATSLITGSATKTYVEEMAGTTDTLTTNSNTATTLNTISTITNAFYGVRAIISAKNQTNNSDFAMYRILFGIKNISGVVTITDNRLLETIEEDDANWDVQLNVNGTDVEIQVVGDASDSIIWKSSLVVQELI